MTDIATTDLTATEARESVRLTKNGLEAAAEQVVRQINGRAWIALGYESWDHMREAEYSGAAVIVPRMDRPQLSARLAAEGLSQKQISETLGVNQATISRDLAVVMQTHNDDSPQTRTDSLGREQPRAKPRAVEPSQPKPEIPAADLVDKPEPPASDFGPLDRQLDAEMEGTDQRFRRNFSAALAKADDIWQFEVDRIAQAYAGDYEQAIRPFLDEMARWCDRVRNARRQASGLRVVNGGAR